MNLVSTPLQRWLLDRFLVSHRLEYLLVNQDLVITEISAGVQHFADSPDDVAQGKDARLGFPELVGAEEKLRAVVVGQEIGFDLKGIARCSEKSAPLYLDLHVIKLVKEELDNHLMLFFEDVTEKMVLEQNLVQSVNETNLLMSALTTSKTYIDRIITSMADALFVTTPSGTIKTINRAAQELLGYSEAELLKQPISIISDESLFFSQASQQLSFAQGEFSQDVEVVCRTKGGETVYVSFSCSAVQTEVEGIQNFVYIGRDITERKQAEEKIKQLNADLQRRTLELEVANKELETFSYSVSHDLRTPLSHLQGFTQLLIADYADQLDADAQSYLQSIYKACRRMAQLINDLLRLAQMTHRELNLDEVDLSTMAEVIAYNLQRNQPERPVEWLIAPDVLALADPQLLKIVLENLLGNAWKYTQKKSQARIEFGVTEQELNSESSTVYFVRDNGAGFNMSHAQKLFTAFQRLHTDTDFEGTGVGLTTVQRIIHRHRGQIWAEATVEQGATFYFTLSP